MQYMTINSKSIPYPNGFTMNRVPRKVGTITTMSGTTYSDISGWKYDSTTLKWDTLLDNDLQRLLQALQDGEFDITFNDVDGVHTVRAVLDSRVSTKTRFTHNGNIVWRDISVSLSFPECYQ